MLESKLFQQTNDALQGKFDPSFYTDAMSSPGISRSYKPRIEDFEIFKDIGSGAFGHV